MRLFKLFLLVCSIGITSSFSQDAYLEDLPEATMANNYYITLPVDVPLTNYYKASITHMGFESQEAGEKLLNIYARGNLVSCDLNLEEGYIVIHVFTEFLDESVTSEEINVYLTRLTQFEGE